MYGPGMENRVGFGLRLGAYLLDFVGVAVVAVLVRGPVGALFPQAIEQLLAEQLNKPGVDPATMAGARPFMEAMTHWAVALGLVTVLYGLIEAFTGRSPGKLLVGLQIVDQSGQRASVGNLLVRYLVKHSGSLVAVVGSVMASKVVQNMSQALGVIVVIGCFLVFGKARLALHDRIAGTAVLRKSDVGVPASNAPTAVASS
jgi:uncharacterized RDD family membrane protein YckC